MQCAEYWLGQRIYPNQLPRLRVGLREANPQMRGEDSAGTDMVQSAGGKKQHLRLARGKDWPSTRRGRVADLGQFWKRNWNTSELKLAGNALSFISF